MMEPLKDQVIHFVDCVVNNKKPLSDGSSGVAVTKILEAALRSVALRGGDYLSQYTFFFR